MTPAAVPGRDRGPRGPSPTLTTPRLVLRDARPGDAEALVDVSVYDGRAAADVDDAAAFLARIRADQDAGETVHWVICLRSDGTPVGTVGFYRGIGREEAEIGYVLRAPYRRRGLAGEAVAAVCRYAADGLGLRRVVADVDGGNAASRALLARAGFVERRRDGTTVRFALDLRAQDSSGSATGPSSPS